MICIMSMFQNFLMKRMLASQMKDVPKEQQDKIFAAIEKNPDFFKNIAEKIQEKMKTGKSQMDASMEVVKEHQAELQKMIN